MKVFSAKRKVQLIGAILLMNCAVRNTQANTNTNTSASDFLLTDDPGPRFKGAGNCSNSATGPCVEELEFCGTDNECHAYSCEAWYHWGPPEYTGHIHGIPIAYGDDSMYLETDGGDRQENELELKCTDNDNPTAGASYAPAIIYGCTSYICSGDGCDRYSKSVDRKEGLAMDYRRRCKADDLGTGYYFVCRDNGDLGNENYDLENDSRLQSFLQSVEYGAVNCSKDYADGPKFIYNRIFKSMINTNQWSPLIVASGPNKTAEFNETKAAVTMHTSLEYSMEYSNKDSNAFRSHWLVSSFILASMIMIFML